MPRKLIPGRPGPTHALDRYQVPTAGLSDREGKNATKPISGYFKRRSFRRRHAGIRGQRRRLCSATRSYMNGSDNSHDMGDMDLNILGRFVRPSLIDIHISET
jgi:hypothetical protein